MVTSNEAIKEQGVMSYSLSELEKHTSRFSNPALIRSAFYFAAGAHSEQVRKFSGLPYVIHPVHVACIVAKHAPSATTELIAACLLHDTVEDTPVDHATIEGLFGFEVARIVDEVTKRDHVHVATNPEISKSALKELERQRLASISPEGQTLKNGDMLSNTRSMRRENPERFESYVLENRRLFDTLVEADPSIRARLSRMFDSMGVKNA